MVLTDVAYKNPFSWVIPPFKYVKERLKSLGWRRSGLVIGGGAVTVYMLCWLLKSGKKEKSESNIEHTPEKPVHQATEKPLNEANEKPLDQVSEKSLQQADQSESRTFSSPIPGTPREDYSSEPEVMYSADPSSESEEMFSADPNYSSSSIYLHQQKAKRMLENNPFSLFNNYKTNGDGKGRRETYEQNRRLETLKHNYENGLLPSFLTKSRNSLSTSFKAIFRMGERCEVLSNS